MSTISELHDFCLQLYTKYRMVVVKKNCVITFSFVIIFCESCNNFLLGMVLSLSNLVRNVKKIVFCMLIKLVLDIAI